MHQCSDDSKSLASEAREKWIIASQKASALGNELFQPGSGYGDPDARIDDEKRLETARLEAERLFREYYDLDKQTIEFEMLKIQKSQRLATWASFSVAFLVGVATIVQVVISILHSRS